MSADRRVPSATYRVQMTSSFNFEAASSIADYLARLGITHLYSSPYLQAGPGSAHGYDVVDHSVVSVELGGPAGRDALCRTLARNGLSQVLDIVPNHMAITGTSNHLWWDVLENGLASRYAHFFDVDWKAREPKLRGKLLLPVLGDRYGAVLAQGGFHVERDAALFTVRYEDHVFPASPESAAPLLSAAAQSCACEDMAFISDALRQLPADPDEARRRHRDKTVLLAFLERALSQSAAARDALDAEVARLNSDLSALDAFLDAQNYQLAYWRVAGAELNYRRFFNINTLIGLRVEKEDVFAETHQLVLSWVREGRITGLRVDHVDGLREPETYLRRLREAAPDAYIVVEKILMPGERIPDTWPVEGTTGYDFLNVVGGLFVDPAGEGPLTDFYAEFTGERADYAQIVRREKRKMLRESFGGDVDRLATMLMDLSESYPSYRDLTRAEIVAALEEAVACFPVYRAYARAEGGWLSADDRRYVTEALDRAARAQPEIDAVLWDFLARLLLLELRGTDEAEFVMRFQQLTGPAMAKGVEDTAFYVYNRLLSLNEVGGDPSRFGVPVSGFHRWCADMARRFPATMLATATHDTKRGEDTRLRISALSEIPARWADAVRRWTGLTARYCTRDLPDRNAEYLLYQTLVGAWPVDADRLVRYMIKAAHEAGTYTPWTNPDPSYEEALRAFVLGILSDPGFVADVERFARPIIDAARVSSLSQTLIKCLAPGVPDFYQGAELEDLSLVDPDNRRPVDYDRRRALLAALDGLSPRDVMARMGEGLPKLYVVKTALAARRAAGELIGPSAVYEPMEARGARAAHVVAFSRGNLAVAVPRLVLGLGGDWAGTTVELKPGRWRNVFTGDGAAGETPLSTLLHEFPVALLAREES